MFRLRPVDALALLAIAGMLPGCGNSNHAVDSSAVLARVNGVAITSAQVNQVVPTLAPQVSAEQRKNAEKAVLEGLVQQEVLVQKAKESKLDREPGVMLAIERAKRGVLADQWLKKATGNVPAPSEQDARRYISQHPEMFTDRKLFNFRVAAIKTTPADIRKIQQQTKDLPTFDATLQYLREHDVKYSVTDQIRASNQFPPDVLRKVNETKEGGQLQFANADRLEIAQLVSVTAAPIAAQGVDAKVASLLRDQAVNQRAQEAINRLAGAAKIEFVGDFKPKGTAATGPVSGTGSPGAAPSDVEKGIASGLN